MQSAPPLRANLFTMGMRLGAGRDMNQAECILLDGLNRPTGDKKKPWSDAVSHRRLSNKGPTSSRHP